MIKKEDVEIILPISNIRGWTDISFKSLPTDVEKIIIFNGTHKSYKNKLIEQYRIKNYLEYDKNIGLSKAFNEGVKKTDKEWMLLMHNDTILPDKFIERLLDSANQILEIDDTIIGFTPVTNYSNELNLIYDNEHYANYIKYKPSNKSLILEDQVKEILTNYYDNNHEGLEALNIFAEKIYDNGLEFSYVPEISHYCLLINKKAFDIVGYFDEDFFPIGFFEKLFFENLMIEGYSFVGLKNCYVHHNGNTSSDFFGFNLSNILKHNQILFESKISERDQKMVFQLNNDVPVKAAFVFLGNQNTDIEIIDDFVFRLTQFEAENTRYSIDLFYSSDSKEFIDKKLSEVKFNNKKEIDINLSSQEDFNRAFELTEDLRKSYDIVRDWTAKIYHS